MRIPDLSTPHRVSTSRFSPTLIAALLLSCAVTGCGGTANTDTASGGGSSSPRRIILLTNGNSPFWDAARFGLQKAAKELAIDEAGLQAVMEVNDGSPQGQINKLRQFASQSDIAGIAVSALDADNVAVADEMRRLRKKGVHVICVDADLNRKTLRDARDYYIGTDNLSAGRTLGKAAKKLLETRRVEKGSYVQFVGRTGSYNARERMDGFREAIGEAYHEADRMGDDLDRTRARDNVRNAIRNHPDLVALVGIWSYNAPAIVDVVQQENIRDKVTVVTFDAEPIAIGQMRDGSIDVMIVQNPFDMGYRAVKLLKALCEKDQKTVDTMFPHRDAPDGDLYNTGLKLIVPDDKGPLKAAEFDGATEFMTLDKFQAWLDQYGLKGS
ncbi:MAG: substrate-binding domain-containing protein [Pirellulales bacterium]